jgi:hypothetical protein
MQPQVLNSGRPGIRHLKRDERKSLAERGAELNEGVTCGIGYPALDPANFRLLDTGGFFKCFLRHMRLLSERRNFSPELCLLGGLKCEET